MSSWYVWSIDQQYYKKVKEFIEDLNGIEEYIYPIVAKEYITKKGKKIKEVPVYSNYIFVKCNHSAKLSVEMKKCRWIRNYIGECSLSEIDSIKNMDGQYYDEVMPNDYGIKIGMRVMLKNTGLFVNVENVAKDILTVSLDIFGQTKVFDCKVSDIQINS